jgi:hypothetical protein
VAQPSRISVDDMAAQDAELVARALNFLVRFGRRRRLAGSDLAHQIYAADKSSDDWKSLVSSLALARPRSDGIASADFETYMATFQDRLLAMLRSLGQAGYETGVIRAPEDPRGAIRPWLMVLEDLETKARPSLLRRLMGRR